MKTCKSVQLLPSFFYSVTKCSAMKKSKVNKKKQFKIKSDSKHNATNRHSHIKKLGRYFLLTQFNTQSLVQHQIPSNARPIWAQTDAYSCGKLYLYEPNDTVTISYFSMLFSLITISFYSHVFLFTFACLVFCIPNLVSSCSGMPLLSLQTISLCSPLLMSEPFLIMLLMWLWHKYWNCSRILTAYHSTSSVVLPIVWKPIFPASSNRILIPFSHVISRIVVVPRFLWFVYVDGFVVHLDLNVLVLVGAIILIINHLTITQLSLAQTNYNPIIIIVDTVPLTRLFCLMSAFEVTCGYESYHQKCHKMSKI